MEQAQLNVRELNREMINLFVNKEAISQECTLSFEEIKIDCDPRIKAILINEFVKSEFIRVTNKRMYFNVKKYKKEKRKIYIVYSLSLFLPLVLGLLLLAL